MNTKHTPGPWHVAANASAIVRDSADRDIAKTLDDNREANARLIAAAPDMLEALHSAVAELTFYADGRHGGTAIVLGKLKAVIAKTVQS